MGQSFRDVLHGSNRKLDQQDESNEELTMTKWKYFRPKIDIF